MTDICHLHPPATPKIPSRRSDELLRSQVKSAPTPVGGPNVRAEAEKKNIDTPWYTRNCTTYRRLSENVVATFRWNRNPRNMEAEHPIEPHFSQQFPNCPKFFFFCFFFSRTFLPQDLGLGLLYWAVSRQRQQSFLHLSEEFPSKIFFTMMLVTLP